MHSSAEHEIEPTKATRGRLSAHIPTETLNHARDISLALLRSFADRSSYILGVTSALPGEGKTTVSIGLAEVMATDFSVNVLLLDTHAEHPWARMDEESTDSLGLSDWLTNACTLPETLVQVYDKCTVIPFGTQLIESRDLLQHLMKVEVLSQFRADYNLIVLDLPDLTNPATAALASLCDGVVLVIQAGHTPADTVQQFLPLLQNVTIHGAVLNRHKPAVPAILRRAFS